MNAIRRRVDAYPKSEIRLTEESGLVAAWNWERAVRLHKKFLNLESALANGGRFKIITRNFLWRMRRTRWRSNGRPARLASSTLHRLFKKWRDNGMAPEALLLRYRSGYPKCPPKFLLAFVEFCSQPRPSLSLLHAWNEFVVTQKSAPPVGYSATLRYFDSVRFRAIQRAYREAAQAEAAAARHRAVAEAFVRSRYAPKGGRP